MERAYIEQEWLPSQTGVNGVLATATTTSNWIDTAASSQVVLEFDVGNISGNVITLVFYVDSQRTNDGSATPFRKEMVGVDAAPGGGEVVTSMYRRKYSYVTPGVIATERFTLPLPGLYNKIRVSGLNGGGAGASDTVTLHVRVRF